MTYTALNVTPLTLALFVIMIGCLVGKIKLKSFSLDLAAILLVAVLAGCIVSVIYSGEYLAALSLSMKELSTLGTALFVSAVGICSGCSAAENFKRNHIIYFTIGVAFSMIGFASIKVISMIDDSISRSALLGVLCGALTSTPGMTAACSIDGAEPGNIALGYGSTYLFGVVFIVFFVQILTRNISCPNMKKIDSKPSQRCAFTSVTTLICLTAVSGTFLGNVFISALGASGGMLVAGMAVGYLYQKCNTKNKISSVDFSVWRNIGLVMFFVGAGIPAGFQFRQSFQARWLMYGMIITLVPVFIGWVICRILKYDNCKTASILAGGITSTPAIAVLADKGAVQDISIYSTVYLGALSTMVIGIPYLKL